MLKPVLALLIYGYFCTFTYAQDLENIGSKTLQKIKTSPLKIQGSINASSVIFNSNQRNSRDPFTYFAQGNLNIGWLTFNMPLSYSYTNQGSNLGYETPFKFNRVSISPKYKWIQAHLGDVSMTFSPYTLSGHQFTGAGFELTPKGKFSVSILGGRFLKAIEDNGSPQTIPTFERMGYGTKLGMKQKSYSLEFIGFYAKDALNSISAVPDEHEITPKENLALSIGSEAKLTKQLNLKASYASTVITGDLRSNDLDSEIIESPLSLVFNTKTSTEFYKAINLGMDTQVNKMKLGIGYEYIDPGYETLGAYFFNNDFENITLNGSTPLLKDKVTINFNVGRQRDNLEGSKEQSTERTVGAINTNVKFNDKITLTANYSNFNTHTNKSLNQFDDINDSDLTDEAQEALDYKQLSQNANANFNWIVKSDDKTNQNINLNYGFASSANQNGTVIRIGQSNHFHNANLLYSLSVNSLNLNLSTSANYNYSDIGLEDTSTYGGSLDVSKKLFDKKITTNLGLTYNTNQAIEATTNIFNIRWTSSTVLAKKHSLNLNIIQLFQNTSDQDALQEFTCTFSYAYSFDIGKPKKKN